MEESQGYFASAVCMVVYFNFYLYESRTDNKSPFGGDLTGMAMTLISSSELMRRSLLTESITGCSRLPLQKTCQIFLDLELPLSPRDQLQQFLTIFFEPGPSLTALLVQLVFWFVYQVKKYVYDSRKWHY